MKFILSDDPTKPFENFCCGDFWWLLEQGFLRFKRNAMFDRGKLCLPKFILTDHLKDGERVSLFRDTGGWTEPICVNFCPSCGTEIEFTA